MGLRFYNGYLVLHDRDTRKKIKNPFIDQYTLNDLYMDELDSVISEFKDKFNEDIIMLDNRVCVDDSNSNRKRFDVMRLFALKLEDKMVKYLNNLRQYNV